MASRNNINLSCFLETVNSERTGETRGERHEVSRSETSANDSVEREGNSRQRVGVRV